MGRHWCPLCRWFVALCLPQQFYCLLPATEYIHEAPDQIHGLLELHCDVMTINLSELTNHPESKKKKNAQMQSQKLLALYRMRLVILICHVWFAL